MTEIPDWLVERVALGEMGGAMRARLDGTGTAEMAARVAALRDQDAAELRAHPAGPAVRQIEARAAQVRGQRAARRRRAQAAALALALGAAAAILLIARTGDRGPAGAGSGETAVARAGGGADRGSDPEPTRIKGAPRLTAFRKAGDRAERLAPGDPVRAGDVLQLRYNGGGRRHGVIASIDGAGAVTLHFPASAEASTALPARTTDLPHAYALDDAPRFERFFLVTDDAPIDVGRTLDALRVLARRGDAEGATLDLPPRVAQLSLLLRKVPAP